MQTFTNITALSEPKDYSHLIRRADMAKQRRGNWEATWQECYDFALPQCADFFGMQAEGRIRTDRLYDGTALDAVDQHRPVAVR